MNDGEVLLRRLGNRNARNPFRGRRQRWEERERKMAYSIPKLRTMGSVPGINGVECFELRDASPFHHSHQVQAGIGNSARAVGKANQREQGTRRPYLGKSSPGRFQRGERKNNVAYRSRPNQETSTGDKIACPTAIC